MHKTQRKIDSTSDAMNPSGEFLGLVEFITTLMVHEKLYPFNCKNFNPS
jgi:hypothetical protein